MTRTPRTAGTTVAGLSTALLVSLSAGLGPDPASAATAAPGAAPGTSTATVAPAGAVPGGFASWQQLQAHQSRLVRAADALSASARGDSGFAGITLSPERREVQLHYKGTPPARVSSAVATARRGVTVRVERARYSAAELSREAAELARAARGGLLTSISPQVDGSGLTVTVAGGAAARARTLAATADVPVDVESGVAPRAASRWDDSAPWHGGAAWRNATRDGGCSTGFAVRHAGRTKMLTAGHCGAPGDQAVDPTGEPIGPVSNDSNIRDVALINARSAGRVFHNTPTLTESTHAVSGTASSYRGLYVCTSGAYSGTRCGIQVKALNQSVYYSGHGWVVGLVRAEKVDRTSALGQGDSGGPVVVPTADRTKVHAAGINSGLDGSTRTACTGYVTSGRICGWRVYYAPMSSAVAAFGTSTVLG